MDHDLPEQGVTYTLSMNGQFYIVENVPARVHPDTGEQFFAPFTVEKLRAIIRADVKPTRVIEASVYDFSSFAG